MGSNGEPDLYSEQEAKIKELQAWVSDLELALMAERWWGTAGAIAAHVQDEGGPPYWALTLIGGKVYTGPYFRETLTRAFASECPEINGPKQPRRGRKPRT